MSTAAAVLPRTTKGGTALSWEASSWARQQRAGGIEQKAVLMLLAEHSDRQGLSWPSQRLLAVEAECGLATVQRYLRALADAGLLTVVPGVGRAPSRYRLAMSDPTVVTRSSGSQDDAETVGSDPASGSQESGEVGRSDPPDDRSDPLILRSDPRRVSDQQEQNRNRSSEPVLQEPTAATRQSRGGRHASGEKVTPAELNATATSPVGFRIVSAWASANPGVTSGHRRKLGRAVDELLAQRADPALMADALDRAHGPKWNNPIKALPFAYEDARRAQTVGAAVDVSSPSPPAVGTSTQRANAFLALRKGERS